MAERTMLVCDTCGRPAVETVMIRSSAGNRQRDYCSTHLDELLAPARIPKRGRKPGSTNRSSAGAKKATAKKSGARRKTTRHKTSTKA
jgi:hypothetical protein